MQCGPWPWQTAGEILAGRIPAAGLPGGEGRERESVAGVEGVSTVVLVRPERVGGGLTAAAGARRRCCAAAAILWRGRRVGGGAGEVPWELKETWGKSVGVGAGSGGGSA